MGNLIKRHYHKIVSLALAFYALYAAGLFMTNVFSSASFTINDCFFKYPIVSSDYSYHYVDAIESAHFFRTKLRIWGYNPYHSAGYLSGIFLAIDNHLALLTNILFAGFVNPALVFNLTIFLSFLVLPSIFFMSLRNFDLGKHGSLIGLLLCMALIMGNFQIRKFFCFGLYSYCLAVFISIYAASLFHQYLNSKSRNITALTFCGAAALFVHPAALLLWAVLGITLCLFNRDRLYRRDFILFLFSIGFIGLVNLLWIFPVLKFCHLLLSHWNSQGFQSPDLQEIRSMLADKDPDFLLFLYLMPAIVVSVLAWVEDKSIRLLGALLVSCGIFTVLLFLGSYANLCSVQPYRFMLPFSLLSVVLISIILDKPLTMRNAEHLTYLSGLFYLFIFLLGRFEPVRFDFGYGRYDQAQKIINFMKNNFSPRARFHVQDTLSYSCPFFGSRFQAVLPIETSLEEVAAPYPWPNTKNNFTQFLDNRIFHLKMSITHKIKFRKYLELYNIKYFLVYGQEAKSFFEKNGDFNRIFMDGPFVIYEYLYSKDSFCYQCQADVHAEYDKITVTKAYEGTTILKYHYYCTLKVVPSFLKIKPVWILKDPLPFILVENGKITDFQIVN